jgi:hypothetical protein
MSDAAGTDSRHVLGESHIFLKTLVVRIGIHRSTVVASDHSVIERAGRSTARSLNLGLSALSYVRVQSELREVIDIAASSLAGSIF